MTKRVHELRAGAIAVAAVLALAAAPLVERWWDAGGVELVASAQAQDHGGGAGGHSGGAGGHSGSDTGGHSGGAGGHSGGAGGHDGGSAHAGGPQFRGGERAEHGTRPDHPGHASGVHGPVQGQSPHGTGADRHFGGGSGLAGLSGVPEGPARMRYTYEHGNQYSYGLGPSGRFRYWGGWVIPGDDGGGGSDDGTTLATPGGGGPSASAGLKVTGRCEDVSERMPSTARLSERNVARATAARGAVAPEDVAGGKVPAPYLMVSFQEELQKPEPDPLVAGTYLGLMAKVAVDAEVVKQVAWRMCVPLDDAQAAAIADVAESQRLAGAKAAPGG